MQSVMDHLRNIQPVSALWNMLHVKLSNAIKATSQELNVADLFLDEEIALSQS